MFEDDKTAAQIRNMADKLVRFAVAETMAQGGKMQPASTVIALAIATGTCMSSLFFVLKDRTEQDRAEFFAAIVEAMHVAQSGHSNSLSPSGEVH